MKDEEEKMKDEEEKMKDEEEKMKDEEEKMKDEEEKKKDEEEKNVIENKIVTENKKIIDIAKYFADRYHLKLNDEIGNSDSEIYGNYITQIKRIMKKVPKDGQNLWDFIKEGEKARMISITDFIYYCFPEWETYIEKKHLDEMKQNPSAYKSFLDDKHLYEFFRMDIILEDKQTELLKYKNDYYEEGFNNLDNLEYAPVEYHKDDEKVKLKGYGFMIEAIYNIFYNDFKWDSLAKDMTLDENRSDEYNTPPTKEEVKAVLSLMDYRNYTVRKFDSKEDTK